MIGSANLLISSFNISIFLNSFFKLKAELRSHRLFLLSKSELQLKRDQLELQRLEEIEAAERTGADVTLINQKFIALNAELEKQSQQAKLKIAANYLTQFNQLINLS